MIAVDLEKVLLAACQGCNEEFSEEPCEPGFCMIRAKLEKLPRVTLDDLRPKGRWEVIEDYVSSLGYTVIDGYRCSLCKEESREALDFCGHCGADMRGGGEDEY